MGDSNKPIIIVRKRKGHKHAHHGGSWKIAYADFMTAMMAFFLVMWLLANSTPQQRQQIAEYFQTPLKVSLHGGEKISLSDSTIPGGGDDFVKQDGEVLRKTLSKLDSQKSQYNLKRAKEKLDAMLLNDPRLKEFKNNISLTLTDDGLLVQVFDTKERPMFRSGSSTLEFYMRDILSALGQVFNDLPNRISLTGHTDSVPYSGQGKAYSNWELSSDRANASRRTLVAAGLRPEKFIRVIGAADEMRLPDVEPHHPSNRRISILLLSLDKEKQILNESLQLSQQFAAQLPPKENMTLHVSDVQNALSLENAPEVTNLNGIGQ